MCLHQHHGAGRVVFFKSAGTVFGSGGVFGQRVSFSASGVENNSVQVKRRGIRIEFGHAHNVSNGGTSFLATPEDIFVLDNNTISLIPDQTLLEKERHGVTFPCFNPDCWDCNIDFLNTFPIPQL